MKFVTAKKDSDVVNRINEILEDTFPESAEATLGENRGQLFVRIPKIVSKRCNLTKGDKLIFNVFNKKDGSVLFEVEVSK